MRDFELDQAVLGQRASWTVDTVELDANRQQVPVTVEAGLGPHPCPECQECQERPQAMGKLGPLLCGHGPEGRG